MQVHNVCNRQKIKAAYSCEIQWISVHIDMVRDT